MRFLYGLIVALLLPAAVSAEMLCESSSFPTSPEGSAAWRDELACTLRDGGGAETGFSGCYSPSSSTAGPGFITVASCTITEAGDLQTLQIGGLANGSQFELRVWQDDGAGNPTTNQVGASIPLTITDTSEQHRNRVVYRFSLPAALPVTVGEFHFSVIENSGSGFWGWTSTKGSNYFAMLSDASPVFAERSAPGGVGIHHFQLSGTLADGGESLAVYRNFQAGQPALGWAEGQVGLPSHPWNQRIDGLVVDCSAGTDCGKAQAYMAALEDYFAGDPTVAGDVTPALGESGLGGSTSELLMRLDVGKANSGESYGRHLVEVDSTAQRYAWLPRSSENGFGEEQVFDPASDRVALPWWDDATRARVQANQGNQCGPTNDPEGEEGDCHCQVVNTDTGVVTENWRCYGPSNPPGDSPNGATAFSAGAQAVWDLTQPLPANGRGDGCTSANAAGTVDLPLIVTPEEVVAGEIKHAMACSTLNAAFAPDAYLRFGVLDGATHTSQTATQENWAPPGIFDSAIHRQIFYGERARLSASAVLDPGAPPFMQVWDTAMRRYGCIYTDGTEGGVTWWALANDALSIAETGTSWADAGLQTGLDLELWYNGGTGLEATDLEFISDVSPANIRTFSAQSCTRTPLSDGTVQLQAQAAPPPVTPAACTIDNNNRTPEPGTDAISFRWSVPAQVTAAGKADDPMFVNEGFIDATWFGADPAPGNDDTAALQAAVDTMQDHDVALFIPNGDYQIDRQLDIRQYLHGTAVQSVESDGCSGINNYRSVTIVGESREGVRINLAQDLWSGVDWSGRGHYQDETTEQRGVIQVTPWRGAATPGSGETDCDDSNEQINVNGEWIGQNAANGFGITLRNFTVNIGTGGDPRDAAVGVILAGAQGSTVENVRVNAGDGYACFGEVGGRSGGGYNLICEGGQRVVDWGKRSQTANIIVGLKAWGQTDVLFESMSRVPNFIVGAEIEIDQSLGARVHKSEFNGLWTVSGAFGFYDVSIDVVGGGDTTLPLFDNQDAGETANSLVLQDVYVRGKSAGRPIVTSSTHTVNAESALWRRITNYAYAHQDPVAAGWDADDHTYSSNTSRGYVYLDGVRQTSVPIVEPMVAEVPPNDIRTQHVHPHPEFFHDDVYSLTGDFCVTQFGNRAVSDEIQAAIDAGYRKLFLGKGLYLLDKQITLGPHTQLVGQSIRHTRLMVQYPQWQTSGSPEAMVTTADAPNGTAILNNLSTHRWGRKDDNGDLSVVDPTRLHHYVDWRAGRLSQVSKVDTRVANNVTKSDPVNVPIDALRWSGSGGGVIRNVQAYKKPETGGPDYNWFAFRGTSQAITIYAPNPEHIKQTGAMMLIDGGSNIRSYGSKVECTTDYWRVSNANNLALHGNGIGCSMDQAGAPMSFTDSDNFELSLISPYEYPVQQTEPLIRHTVGGSTVWEVDHGDSATYLRQGTFDDSVFRHRE